jgi:RNA polymerase sigma-70 factor (ECF subfamily)
MRDGSDDFDEFCRRLYPRLVGALILQSGDRPVAEEIAQEALARAWERWRTVSLMDEPGGWVFRVALNLSHSQFRRRGAERRASRKTAVAPAAPPDQADAVAVRAAVSRLPSRQRTAVVLRYFADLGVDATAEAMRCRPGTVKALTHQGVAQLRRWLQEVEELDNA